MEVFGYHPDLKKWTEIGNSGMFRPEMLAPMGLPKDVRVIACECRLCSADDEALSWFLFLVGILFANNLGSPYWIFVRCFCFVFFFSRGIIVGATHDDQVSYRHHQKLVSA